MDEQNRIEEIIEKLKGYVSEGSVSRVRLERHGETLINVPMPAGVIGAVVGLTAAPIATIAGALVTFGLDCEVVVVRPDGSEVNLNHTQVGETLENVKETVKEKVSEAFRSDDDTPAGPDEGLE